MNINKNVKYRDILTIAIIAIILYKLIDNYEILFKITNRFMSIISPFIYAIVFAYMLNPIMMFLERQFKMSRGKSILATYAIITGIVIIFFFFTIPSLIDSIGSISKEVPNYMDTIQEWIDKAIKNPKISQLIINAGLVDKIEFLSIKMGNFTVTLLQGMLSYLLSFTGNLVKIIFGFLIAVYVLNDKEQLINGLKTLMHIILKEKKADKLIKACKIYNKMIGVYIGTKAIDSAIIGFIALICLVIVKSPYALLLSIIVAVTNMIPYFGPFIGEIVGVVMCIFVSPMKALIVFILLLLIQQFDAWYLDPKLIGAKVGVKPFWIIMGVIIGGAFWGPIGMLLASPTLATINIYYIRLVEYYKRKDPSLFKKL
ncbi:AI-2E family transporter [Clostridium taeniosporum]|uniref:AI-2E family transporter n=1 Tax=Clostridium taeniosporum TaxID=394958 RepID=A0A1D7XLK4_9CLOT|nr:AI-2E family transporter [Clostridium taeniosporum]AOR24070.1 AI-2E family transporter [Clostridium taeniosporum]